MKLGLCASDMRVRMLVRASMYASSCMCAVARMCAWFSACFSVLALACMLTPTFVFASVFVYVLLCVCFVQDYVCVSAKVRQHHPWVMSKGLCPRSWVSENQARAARAREDSSVYIYIYIYSRALRHSADLYLFLKPSG